jgi:hypothetical protein
MSGQQKSVVLTGKADRYACGTRPTRATDTMNVVLRVFGQVVIHHVRDALYVNPASSDISGDHDFELRPI